MPAYQEPAQDEGAVQGESEIARLGNVFIEQIRAHGRIHYRALLRAMREHPGEGATDTSQEVALILRRKLRLRPRKVRDIEGVRRALAGGPDAGEDSR